MTPGLTSNCPSIILVISDVDVLVISTSYTYLPAFKAFVVVADNPIFTIPPLVLNTEDVNAVDVVDV